VTDTTYIQLHGDIVSVNMGAALFKSYKTKRSYLIPLKCIQHGGDLEPDTEIHINIDTKWIDQFGRSEV